MKQSGTISSEGLGKRIRVSGSLDKPTDFEYWSDVKGYRDFRDKMHIKCGGDKDRTTRFLKQMNLFLRARPDIQTLKQLEHYIYYNDIVKKGSELMESQKKSFLLNKDDS